MNGFRKSKPLAPRITIFGKPGVGKSTLASKFPEPIFLLTEYNDVPDIVEFKTGDNVSSVYVDYVHFFNDIKHLLEIEKPQFKTIVIDSVSKLDSLVVQYTLDKSPKKAETLAEAWGGYGAGFEKVTLLHKATKNLLDKFKERGISVVYVSHVEIKKYKSPEEEDYDILSIAMSTDKARSVYIDDVDAVLYCKNKSNLIEVNKTTGRSIIKSSGKKIIKTCSSDALVSKNRFNMPDEIPMEFDEIEKYIPFYNINK